MISPLRYIEDRLREKKEARARRYAEYIDREAKTRLQLREWNGKIYICFDDTPLFSCEDSLTMLESLRGTWTAYHKRS